MYILLYKAEHICSEFYGTMRTSSACVILLVSPLFLILSQITTSTWYAFPKNLENLDDICFLGTTMYSDVELFNFKWTIIK